MQTSNAIKKRALSSFNVSIHTGLPLETLFVPTSVRVDESREIPILTKEYKILYISLFTMVRNLIAALSAADKKAVFTDMRSKSITIAIEEEIETIKAIGAAVDKQIIIFPQKDKPVLRLRDRPPTNDDRVKEVYKTIRDRLDLKYISSYEPNSIMLTSTGVDLLNFKGLWLRSTTGEIVEPLSFNKVYKKLKDLDLTNLPFVESLFKIYGDGTGLVVTATPKVRRDIFNHLMKEGVTSRRSESWVRNKMRSY